MVWGTKRIREQRNELGGPVWWGKNIFFKQNVQSAQIYMKCYDAFVYVDVWATPLTLRDMKDIIVLPSSFLRLIVGRNVNPGGFVDLFPPQVKVSTCVITKRLPGWRPVCQTIGFQKICVLQIKFIWSPKSYCCLRGLYKLHRCNPPCPHTLKTWWRASHDVLYWQ